MSRWKKDAKEFEVGVMTLTSKNGPDSKTCTIPKPIYELLNEPARVQFKIVGKHIEIKDV